MVPGVATLAPGCAASSLPDCGGVGGGAAPGAPGYLPEYCKALKVFLCCLTAAEGWPLLPLLGCRHEKAAAESV